MGYQWHPIAPLAEDWQSLATSEMAALRVVWTDLQDEFGSAVGATLRARMVTEWGIETGMVENLYRWDRGVTETLLAHGVRADRIPSGASSWSPEVVAQVIQDQIDTVDGLFSYIKEERPLGTSFVHELHAQLLKNTPRDFDLGKWKTRPNAVRLSDGSVHEYCPPEHVAYEMERLLEMHDLQVANKVPVEIRAAWLHHRFTQIHPYPDGNGRTARALASLLFIKEGLLPVIIRADEKALYFDVLEAADGGSDEPLIEHFRAMQRRQIVKLSVDAEGAATHTPPASSMDEVILRAQQKLGVKSRDLPGRWAPLPSKIVALNADATRRVDELAATLNQRFNDPTRFRFLRTTEDGQSTKELGLRAEFLDYVPAEGRTVRNICLGLMEGWRIVVSIHDTAPREQSLAGCVVFLAPYNDTMQESLSRPGNYFLISYAEPLEELRSRFSKWLERQLIAALDLWQRQL